MSEMIPVTLRINIPNKDLVILAAACGIVIPVSYKVASRITEKILNKVSPR